MDTSSLRGFNYQPGYSAHLQCTWTNFDRDSWEREVPYARRFGSNMLRVWLDWSAYLAVGNRVLDALEEALAILDRNGLQMMPVLFNRWSDPRFPAGVLPNDFFRQAGWEFTPVLRYVDALLERFANDGRIGMWDICNEPQTPYEPPEISLRELAWLARITDRVRRKSHLPITIGTMTDDNVRISSPLVDVISFHPYPHAVGEMKKLCEDHLQIAAAYDKPLICTETCVGSFDDIERGTLARDCIETLESYNIGWLAWQLCSGQFVTGSRHKTDDNAVRRGEGYMPFVLPDGTTRPGHEWLEERNIRS